MMMVNNAMEPFSADYVAESLAEWLPKASAAGITTLFDAGMQVVPETEGFAIYDRLERAGKAAVPGDRILLSQQAGDRSRAGDPGAAPGIQLGAGEGFGAEAEHRRRRSAANRGVFRALRRRARNERRHAAASRHVRRHHPARRPRRPRHPHSFLRRSGDAPVARRLRGRDQGQSAARPPAYALAHLFLVAPEDLPRFAKLGVIAQFSTQWAVPDPALAKDIAGPLGRLASDEQYRFGSILRARRRAVARHRLAGRGLPQHLPSARRDRGRHDPARTRQARRPAACACSTR